MRNRMFRWIWGVAEQMDWQGIPPRWFWRALLKWCDRRAGYHLEYDE